MLDDRSFDQEGEEEEEAKGEDERAINLIAYDQEKGNLSADHGF